MLTTDDCCLMVLSGVDINASDVIGDGVGGTPPARRPQGPCRYPCSRISPYLLADKGQFDGGRLHVGAGVTPFAIKSPQRPRRWVTPWALVEKSKSKSKTPPAGVVQKQLQKQLQMQKLLPGAVVFSSVVLLGLSH